MYDYATKNTSDSNRSRVAHPGKRGSALVSTLVVFAAVSGLLIATSALSSVEVNQARRTMSQLQASSVAESGLEMGKALFQDAATKTAAINPIDGIANLFNGGTEMSLFDGAPLTSNGATIGAYSARAVIVDRQSTSIDIRVEATGYLPDAPQNLPVGTPVRAWNAQSVVMRFQLEAANVFDYSYFVNNWGWFYGSTIYCNGNARSNGQFDSGNRKPFINGQPNYEDVSFDGTTASLSGYQDDNGDGAADGGDGGVWSGWDIVRSDHVRGVGGQTQNQHEFEEQLPMPNLSDLTLYETMATDASSSISVGGSTVVSGVLGDDAGENQHLYLEGTLADPIVLNGPVVIRGDVIIKGYVTGKGAIYSGGNTYVPDSITYVNGPSSTRPADNTQASTEAWLSSNWDKDFLGLFSAENVVVGDFTNNTWRSYVSSWMGSSMNSSKEDAGEDGIPNTRAGRDGILGTADDDVLEGDGVYTVEFYSAQDDAMGLIPSGYAVGDVIPGTGEDIDGDGQYDGTTTLNDLDFQDSLHPSNWGGNMPGAGLASYSSIATMYANNMDASFYTNHSFCYVVFGGSPARINGSMVARNENIVYGTPSIEINYDARLLGGVSGAAGDLLPRLLAPVQILQWRPLENDPILAASQHITTGVTP